MAEEKVEAKKLLSRSIVVQANKENPVTHHANHHNLDFDSSHTDKIKHLNSRNSVIASL